MCLKLDLLCTKLGNKVWDVVELKFKKKNQIKQKYARSVLYPNEKPIASDKKNKSQPKSCNRDVGQNLFVDRYKLTPEN
jgi:hypothetical protein